MTSVIDLENKVCIVTVDTLQHLFTEYWWDPVSLYMFYYKQWKLQKTNQPLALDSFVIKWMRWWKDKFLKNKKILKEEWLISWVKQRDAQWVIVGHYIRVSYIRWQEKSKDLVHKYQNQRVDLSTSGVWTTNAWSTLSINAWSSKTKKTTKKKKWFIPPTKEEVIDYFEQKWYVKQQAITAREYYDAWDWKDSRGNQVRSWKQKMISVWMKPEFKKKLTIKEHEDLKQDIKSMKELWIID